MPTEAANELLEPGSGAPDVKKILERVRASQNAARGKPASETDRADYIAAARRAAQAAAMEVDANPKQAAVKGEKKGARRKAIRLAKPARPAPSRATAGRSCLRSAPCCSPSWPFRLPER